MQRGLDGYMTKTIDHVVTQTAESKLSGVNLQVESVGPATPGGCDMIKKETDPKSYVIRVWGGAIAVNMQSMSWWSRLALKQRPRSFSCVPNVSNTNKSRDFLATLVSIFIGVVLLVPRLKCSRLVPALDDLRRKIEKGSTQNA